MRLTVAMAVAATLALSACGGGQPAATAPPPVPAAPADAATHFQQQLLQARPGEVITLPAGTLHFRRGLVLRTNGVTIRGAGIEKTILSFKGMVSGPQGLLVNANDFTIENLSIEDTMGDALKIKQGENIVIRGVRTAWTRGPDKDNGAYGMYPIRVTNLLIEDSVASGASDSGIYVGQSKNVVVRHNHLSENVAGIEIENTSDADVYANTATNNTGGILVFNMPNLMVDGANTRVYDNDVSANNLANFGARGTPVASVPAGSGVVVNSNDRVEVFRNRIADNKTANVIVSSYFSTNYANKPGVNPGYNPYPKGISIHDNQFSGGGDAPDGLEFKALKTALFGINGRFPDVVWDGYFDLRSVGKDGLPPAADRICVPDPKVGVLNLDGPHGYKKPSTDDAAFRCRLDPLSPVKLALAATEKRP